MSLTPEQLRCIPLLRGIDDNQLKQLSSVFEKRDLPEGETLFEAGKPARAFYLLASGEVAIWEGDQIRYRLRPPAAIGELGALSDLNRVTTATVSRAAEVWQVTKAALLSFFEDHGEIAMPFYQNMVELIGDKMRRDQVRLEDMRSNIIRTQKVMKQLRDFVLESQDTPISDRLHNKLDDMIRNNRRVNYRVSPPDTLQAQVRLNDKSTVPVVQISRTHISFTVPGGPLPEDGSAWSGVVNLCGPEIPISGTVLRCIDRRVDLMLDLLIDDYGSTLDGYLARVQMLDFMV
jgi:CRP/FNR family cyclic AMP-dependent transcriptional regulator